MRSISQLELSNVTGGIAVPDYGDLTEQEFRSYFQQYGFDFLCEQSTRENAQECQSRIEAGGGLGGLLGSIGTVVGALVGALIGGALAARNTPACTNGGGRDYSPEGAPGGWITQTP